MQKLRRHCLSAVFVMVIVFVVVANVYEGRHRATIDQTRITERQVRECAEAISRVLAPDDVPLHLTATLERMYNANGTPRLMWIVEVNSGTGGHVANFRWDANTGEMEEASHPQSWPLGYRTLTANEALTATKYWLGSLDLTAKPPAWRLVSKPRRTLLSWLTTWETEGRIVDMTVDAHTGELIFAAGRHRR